MHEEFQTVLREHLARYPLMEPQDCAKLAYQSTFGPAHAAGERGDVLRQLLGECSALPADREARPPERIGNGLCRVHLSGTGDWTLAAPLLADLLLLTAAEHHGTAADLEECLTAAEALPLPGETALPLSHSLARLARENETCAQMAAAQSRASDLGALCRTKPEPMGGIYRQKIIFLTN